MEVSLETVGGHKVTAGLTLAFMGCVGLAGALLSTQVQPQPLGFIDGPSVALIALTMAALGAALAWNGRHDHRPVN